MADETGGRDTIEARTNGQRVLRACAAAPFLVGACLLAAMLLSPWTGMRGPSSNTYFLIAVTATAIGFIAGVTGLLRIQGRVWIRVLVGLMYIPTVLVSLLSSGA